MNKIHVTEEEKRIKVYIIILNYNNWFDTIECLESVLRNDYSNYQVIVVDNNSPNNSMDYIKAWAEGKLDVWVKPDHPLRHLSFPPVQKPIPYVCYTREEAEKGGDSNLEKKIAKNVPKDINMRYPLIFIKMTENLGFAGGNNAGIRYALSKNDFEYVLILNNDTVVDRKFLLNLIREALKNNFGITGCKILNYENPRKLWYNGGKFNIWLGRTKHIKREISRKFSEVNFITGCCMFISRNILNTIDLLDESYFMYVEDLDYSYRAIKEGFKLGVVHDATIYHKIGASSGGEINPFVLYLYYRNKIIFGSKRINGIKKIIFLTCAFNKFVFLLIKYFIIKPKVLKHIICGHLDGLKYIIKSHKN